MLNKIIFKIAKSKIVKNFMREKKVDNVNSLQGFIKYYYTNPNNYNDEELIKKFEEMFNKIGYVALTKDRSYTNELVTYFED